MVKARSNRVSRSTEVARLLDQEGEIANIVRRVRVIGAKSLLINRQRALEERACRGKIALVFEQRPRLPRLAAVAGWSAPNDLFDAGERALEQRPRRSKIPLVAKQ